MVSMITKKQTPDEWLLAEFDERWAQGEADLEEYRSEYRWPNTTHTSVAFVSTTNHVRPMASFEDDWPYCSYADSPLSGDHDHRYCVAGAAVWRVYPKWDDLIEEEFEVNLDFVHMMNLPLTYDMVSA